MKKFMKIVTWNVNGLRAIIKKDFIKNYKKLNADIFCMQETKLQKEQIPKELDNICDNMYWNSAIKKGYSGTAVFSNNEPLNVIYGIGSDLHDEEGRSITLEYDDFYLVNCYVPNAQMELKRLDFRLDWEEKLLKYLKKLDKKKPVIYCGDLNVAHNEIDLKNPKQNVGNPGFSDEERQAMTKLLNSGFIDVYRKKYNDKIEYTWWSYRAKARENNVGWRIDYFVISERLFSKVKNIKIHSNIMGSDHCPVEIEF